MFGKRSDQTRTADDRARAAAERAARREGRPLPPEAFEDAVRPPDVQPRSVRRVERPQPAPEPPREEPRREAAPTPREEAAPAARDDAGARDAAPTRPTEPRAGAAPRSEAPGRASEADARDAAPARPREAAPTARSDARPGASETAPAARDDGSARTTGATPAAGETAPTARSDAPARPSEPRGDAAPTARNDAPAARNDAPAARNDAPAARNDAPAARNDTPAARNDTPAAREDAPAESRLEAASEAARRDDRLPSEYLHQPTVEYTPSFQTDEHEAARFHTEEHEAPLGVPRDGEPEIVASRRPGSTATAEHGLLSDEEPEDEQPRPAKPLRAAPPRADDAAKSPRKRPAPNAPRRGRRTPPPAKVGRGTGNGHWGRRIFAVIAIAVLAGLLYVGNATFQPFHGDPGDSVRVTIPENSDAGQIGDILAQAGVIDSATFFQLSATIDGSRGSLRPGEYTLKQGMSNDDVIAELTKLPEEATPTPTVTLTLIEGPSRRENAPVVDKSKKVRGEYAKASGSKATLERIREFGAPKGTKTAEGFLFPATYELPEGSSANDLVTAQLDAFEENFKQVDMSYAKRKNLSRYDVLIIASLIEREASLAKERRLVSAVIYNRLSEGMPLQIDATTRYSTNNWTKEILQSQLDKDEPYNTRLKRGLPPTPIGNPGLASLKAAAKPSSKKYLYYVRKKNDDSGEHGFYTSYSEFEKARQRYQASRESG